MTSIILRQAYKSLKYLLSVKADSVWRQKDGDRDRSVAESSWKGLSKCLYTNRTKACSRYWVWLRRVNVVHYTSVWTLCFAPQKYKSKDACESEMNGQGGRELEDESGLLAYWARGYWGWLVICPCGPPETEMLKPRGPINSWMDCSLTSSAPWVCSLHGTEVFKIWSGTLGSTHSRTIETWMFLVFLFLLTGLTNMLNEQEIFV